MTIPAPAPSSPVTEAVLDLAEHAGPTGIAMGAIVDALVGRGFAATAIEQEIWALLGRRRLTPCGFVCRVVHRRAATGESHKQRVYEFMLVPWSAALDHQLELDLERK